MPEPKNKTVKEKPKSKPVKSVKKKSKDIELNKFVIDGHFVHIKVGNEMKPADTSDIQAIEEKITTIIDANNINCIVFVTHHAVDINVY